MSHTTLPRGGMISLLNMPTWISVNKALHQQKAEHDCYFLITHFTRNQLTIVLRFSISFLIRAKTR